LLGGDWVGLSALVFFVGGTWACGPGWYVSRLWRLVSVRGLGVAPGLVSVGLCGCDEGNAGILDLRSRMTVGVGWVVALGSRWG
jgi:hypothetical protein